MVKDLHTLIRLNEWSVDQRRRDLGEVLGSLADLESSLHRLGEELVREQRAVLASPEEAGFLYGNYANAVIGRRNHINTGIANMEQQVAEAREKLDEAYRELKKYEVVQETRDLRQAREEARQEQIELDEMGLQAYRRKHG
jgi:flagellar export protein FliJ